VLVGRKAERAEIGRLLGDARARASGALVLSGEPGIGKSALCAWAATRAAGMRVLTARGVQSEVDLPFAGLAELCAGQLDRLGRLPAPQAHALDGALVRGAASPGDRFAIGAGLLSLLAVAGEEEPALVVVDDAQWLDGASADAVLFAARRLRNEGVAMLAATRPGSVFDAERTGVARLSVGGLDGRSARALLFAPAFAVATTGPRFTASPSTPMVADTASEPVERASAVMLKLAPPSGIDCGSGNAYEVVPSFGLKLAVPPESGIAQSSGKSIPVLSTRTLCRVSGAAAAVVAAAPLTSRTSGRTRWVLRRRGRGTGSRKFP